MKLSTIFCSGQGKSRELRTGVNSMILEHTICCIYEYREMIIMKYTQSRSPNDIDISWWTMCHALGVT